MNRQSWTWAVGALTALVAVGLILAAFTHTDKNSNLIVTTHKARDIILACQAYRQHPGSGGKYPAKLSDLLAPPFGGGSFAWELGAGEHALLDPWGNPFRYAIVPNESGDSEVYVWAERTKDGATTLIGAKRTTNGEIIAFGLPPDP